MSTPQPPQSPYGAQNPYAPQNPYLQPQPPQAPYPSGPYGQPQPQPQQPYVYGGWGAPPMAPPPKRRLGRVFTIVGVVALAVVGYAVLQTAAKNTGYPAAEYTLSLPKTLLSGRYELARDYSDSEGQKIVDASGGYSDAKVDGAAVAQYSLAGNPTEGSLVVSGMYGRFKEPDVSRNHMMKGAGEGAKVALAPQDFHPDGSEGVTVTCEVLTKTQAGTDMTVPVCAWTDANTGASVGELRTSTMTQDPSDVDLEKLAATTLLIRSEMRKPIGG
ncbi:hypothetical protein AB0D34_33075 [Streptomyces sp. NPDC048420]|uniref:hypothetical protein n=1 Tax=Streptomyces sp. NPDC048420 TaxID=3155755 RepID=UPI00341F4E75